MEDRVVGQVVRTILSPMGRANERPRKGNKPQHLAKVGSAPDMRNEGQKERGAVMDVMGLGNLSAGTRSAFFIIGVLILVAAIVAVVIYSI